MELCVLCCRFGFVGFLFCFLRVSLGFGGASKIYLKNPTLMRGAAHATSLGSVGNGGKEKGGKPWTPTPGATKDPPRALTRAMAGGRSEVSAAGVPEQYLVFVNFPVSFVYYSTMSGPLPPAPKACRRCMLG